MKFSKTKSNGNQTFEIWSHRGIHNELPENSIEAVRLAAKQGFGGVEVDVFYDNEIGFVVSHDKPYKQIDGELLLLEQLLLSSHQHLKFWIDLKNLNQTNKKAVLMEFKQLFVKQPSLEYRIFIESSKGRALRTLSNNGVQSNLWVQYSKYGLKKWLKLWYLKAIICHSSFCGITTHYRYIDEEFAKIFNSFDWYIFTVNDLTLIESLESYSATSVILTDLEGSYVFE